MAYAGVVHAAPQGTLEVRSYRGPILEDRHSVHLAVVDPAGALLAHAGDPHRVNPLRSTAKPFQVQALLTSDAFASGALALPDDEIAVACASHDGTDAHLATVRRLLARGALPESALACGPHAPGDPDAAAALVRAGADPTSIHNNCSGKHAAMLLAADALGAPRDGYLEEGHAVQRRIAGFIAALAGVPGAQAGVDGCSAPTLGLPLSGLARMFARLVHPDPEREGERLAAGLTRACAAMRAHPEVVAGERHLDTWLMREVPGLVAKRGAAGCYGLGWLRPDGSALGLALKVDDGDVESRAPAVLAALEALGADVSAPSLAGWRRPRITNCLGRVVGHREVRVQLAR